MKRICMGLVVALLSAIPALAQDDVVKMKTELEDLLTHAKVLGVTGAAMGATIKNAPYSAVEVTESTQVLGDGTRIHNERKTSVYRDSEGRVRRETPDQITIWDPVANVSYFLDPKTQTAQKASVMRSLVMRREAAPAGMTGGAVAAGGGRGARATFEVRASNENGVKSVTVNGQPVDPATIQHEDMVWTTAQPVMMERMPADGGGFGGVVTSIRRVPAKTEPLGQRVIEGVTSDGTRTTSTLETGAIGNDRPIETVSERWYSAELQTVVMTRRNDPRTGEETFRLTNVNRAEPAAYLFQLPPGYQLQEKK